MLLKIRLILPKFISSKTKVPDGTTAMYNDMCLFNLLPVPKTSGFVALYHWKMFRLAMLTLPPIYH